VSCRSLLFLREERWSTLVEPEMSNRSDDTEFWWEQPEPYIGSEVFFNRRDQGRDSAGHPSSMLLILREPEKRRYGVKVLVVDERSQSYSDHHLESLRREKIEANQTFIGRYWIWKGQRKGGL
jgi:hypothetical protein